MSEYWVSKGRYFCKYCNVYIADDKPSRQHHETGMRHKGNLERYIRDIYKKGAQKEKDKVDEERAMRAIDAAAAASMGISSAQASSSKPKEPAAPPTRKTAASSSGDPWSNYTTAESLGFVDTDALKAQEEKELREKEGRAGDWSIVTPAAGKKKKEPSEEPEASTSQAQQRRRDHEDPSTKRISHSYLTEKALPSLDDEDEYDKIAIKIKAPKFTRQKDVLAKAMEQAKTQGPEGGPKPGSSSSAGAGGGKFKFKPVVAGEVVEETEEEVQVRQQAAWDLIAPPEDAKPDVSDAPAVRMFKKRKAGAAAGASSVTSAKRRAA